jgi:hypothetical protein
MFVFSFFLIKGIDCLGNEVPKERRGGLLLSGLC